MRVILIRKTGIQEASRNRNPGRSWEYFERLMTDRFSKLSTSSCLPAFLIPEIEKRWTQKPFRRRIKFFKRL
jgi:hypothetical protein